MNRYILDLAPFNCVEIIFGPSKIQNLSFERIKTKPIHHKMPAVAVPQTPSEWIGNGESNTGGLKLWLKNEIKHELQDELAHTLKEMLDRELNGDTNGVTTNGNGVASQPLAAPGSASYTPPSSIFKPICHPRVEDAIREVDGHYLKNWSFPDAKARKRFVNAGFSRVTSLYFPKALDSRINYACSLLTILFLIDGM